MSHLNSAARHQHVSRQPDDSGFSEHLGVTAAEIAAQLSAAGATCVTGVVSDEWLCAARESIATHLPITGSELEIKGAAAESHSFVRQFVRAPHVLALLRSVAVAGYPQLDRDHDDVETTIRIVLGDNAPAQPLWFHYDRSVVTMVVPITIPRGDPQRSGELILCPNRRPFRRFVVTNIVEKAVVQTDLYRRRFQRTLDVNRDATVIPLQPGNAYLFSGYRTYHATFPCEPDALRLTMVIMFGAVHGGHPLLRAAQWLRGCLRGFRSGTNAHKQTAHVDELSTLRSGH
jgi:hypothetical protein